MMGSSSHLTSSSSSFSNPAFSSPLPPHQSLPSRHGRSGQPTRQSHSTVHSRQPNLRQPSICRSNERDHERTWHPSRPLSHQPPLSPPRTAPQRRLSLNAVLPFSDGRSALSIITSFTSPAALITPPIDNENVQWDPTSKQMILDQYTAQPPTPTTPSTHEFNGQNALSSKTDAASHTQLGEKVAAENNSHSVDGSRQSDAETRGALSNGIALAVSQLDLETSQTPSLRILSQTLPCPASVDDGSSSYPTAAFSHILQRIGSTVRAEQSPYVTITHAMPSKSSLSSLPTSLLASSNDHTNLKVFSAAAPANGYDAPETQNPLTRSPLVPPQTIHTAVIERYLPPSSRLEYDNIFSAGAKSILIDRLNELTPDGGSMVLIYPTKKGVRTFKRDYLGPTLDPVIRRLIVTKGLPCDVASHLGNIFSPTYMDEYEDMKKKVQGICAANTNDQDGTSPDEYSLIYSGTDSVRMSPSIWIEWFLYQAGPRARAMLNNYCRSSPRACHLDHFNSSDSRSSTEVNSSLMLQEIWDGMRLNAMNAEPVAGIEVGVFVIQRSHCTQHAASAA